MNFVESCLPGGQLFFCVRRRGRIIEEFSENNMIMLNGRVAVARLFAGLPGGNGLKVGAGEGDEAPDPGQASLTNQYLVEASSIRFARAEVSDEITAWVPSDDPTPNVRLDFVFGTGDANGLGIREFGLFCADGTMFARRIRTNGKPIEKDGDLTIEGYWIIRF